MLQLLPHSPPTELGESPRWDEQTQTLYWCDIVQGSLHAWHEPSETHRSWRFPGDLACCVLVQLDMAGRAPRLILARRDGLFLFESASGQLRLLAEAPYDRAQQRFNDGCCDAQGRFWIGTIYEPRDQTAAQLYCLSAAGLHASAQGYTVVNGLAFSPDARAMYCADTTSHTVYRYPYEAQTGALGERQVFVKFTDSRIQGGPPQVYGGRPDGACVDAEGCYWIAMYEGARVMRFSPQGRCLQEIALPVQCPTMLCLGGSDMRTLFITTARHRRPAIELRLQAWAGHVLRTRVDVPGLHSARFRMTTSEQTA